MNDYEQSQSFGGVIDVLEAIGAQYAIWGGLAVVAYGEPRFTQDMDILLSKLRAYGDSQSTRHLDDIASIVRLQRNKLDRERLDVAAAQLGLLGVWRSLWDANQP